MPLRHARLAKRRPDGRLACILCAVWLVLCCHSAGAGEFTDKAMELLHKGKEKVASFVKKLKGDGGAPEEEAAGGRGASGDFLARYTYLAGRLSQLQDDCAAALRTCEWLLNRSGKADLRPYLEERCKVLEDHLRLQQQLLEELAGMPAIDSERGELLRGVAQRMKKQQEAFDRVKAALEGRIGASATRHVGESDPTAKETGAGETDELLSYKDLGASEAPEDRREKRAAPVLEKSGRTLSSAGGGGDGGEELHGGAGVPGSLDELDPDESPLSEWIDEWLAQAGLDEYGRLITPNVIAKATPDMDGMTRLEYVWKLQRNHTGKGKVTLEEYVRMKLESLESTRDHGALKARPAPGGAKQGAQPDVSHAVPRPGAKD